MYDNSKFSVFSFFENPRFVYHHFFTGIVSNPHITHCYRYRTINLYTFIILTGIIVSSLYPWLKAKPLSLG